MVPVRLCCVVAMLMASRSLVAAEPDPPSVPRDQLTPDETALIEARTCGTSPAGEIAEKRTHWSGRGFWDVDLQCKPQGSARGLALREVTHCVGLDKDWHCDPMGIEIDLPPGGWQRPVYVGHTAPDRGLAVWDFLEQQARLKKNSIDADTLAGYPAIIWVEGNDNYHVTFTFSDWEFSYHVTERCGTRGCKRKLEYEGMYQSFLDLE